MVSGDFYQPKGSFFRLPIMSCDRFQKDVVCEDSLSSGLIKYHFW